LRPSRLLFVTNLYPPAALGGYEYVCQNVAEALRERGHDITVLTSSYRSEDLPAEPGTLRRLWLRRDYGNGRAAGPGGRFGVERHNSRAIADVLARNRPDLVMFWNGTNMGRSLLTAAERAGEVVYYVHDPWLAPVLTADRQPRSLAGALTRAALLPLGIRIEPLRARNVIFISNALRDQYRELGAGVDGAAVIRNGIPPNLFPPRPPHLLAHAAGEPYRILYSGRIAPEKGIGTLIRALSTVRQMPGLEQTRLTLLGDPGSPDYAVQVAQSIESAGVRDAVTILPRRSRVAVADAYAEHDVLAFPSEWREPFSLTLLEAMATGLPVVSTLSGGSAELLRHGDNALVFRAGDATDLAEKLQWALTHPSEMSAIAAAAGRDVRRDYTFTGQVDALEAAIEVAQGRRGGE
jgi:glycogen synthase